MAGLDLLVAPAEGSGRGFFRRVDRAVQVLRFYRKRQMAWRAWKVAKRKVFGAVSGSAGEARGGDTAIKADAAGLARLRALEGWRREGGAGGGGGVEVGALRRGEFELLNRAGGLGWPVDWRAGGLEPKASHLWRFHLHYQGYVLGLARAGEAPRALELMGSWISGNRFSDSVCHDDAWHPYCISRRLPIWLSVLALVEAEEETVRPILASAAQQARHLHRHLEWDLRGNHLLENLRALTVAAHVLEVPEAGDWLATVRRVLPGQLEEQVLGHGEHFERSPMYHVQALAGLVEMAAVSGEGDAVSSVCLPVIAKMADFLEGVLHPDGEIPFFADSCWGEAPPVAEVLACVAGVLAGAEGKSEASVGACVVGPYWVARGAGERGGDCLIFDGGEVAAASLPAHGHGDLLGFEGSVGGRRWLVDSGVFNYEDDAMRAYCRSTRGHNAVEVGGENQCDVWSRFRMGRRGRVRGFRHGCTGGFDWCHGSHDGYRRRGVSVARVMACGEAGGGGGGVWGCWERVSGAGVGGGGMRVVGYLHLHPGVGVEEVGEGGVDFCLCDGAQTRWLRFVGAGSVVLKQGWYCEGFGKRAASVVFAYAAEAGVGVGGLGSVQTFGWVLAASEAGLGTDFSEVLEAGFGG